MFAKRCQANLRLKVMQHLKEIKECLGVPKSTKMCRLESTKQIKTRKYHTMHVNKGWKSVDMNTRILDLEEDIPGSVHLHSNLRCHSPVQQILSYYTCWNWIPAYGSQSHPPDNTMSLDLRAEVKDFFNHPTKKWWLPLLIPMGKKMFGTVIWTWYDFLKWHTFSVQDSEKIVHIIAA